MISFFRIGSLILFDNIQKTRLYDFIVFVTVDNQTQAFQLQIVFDKDDILQQWQDLFDLICRTIVDVVQYLVY